MDGSHSDSDDASLNPALNPTMLTGRRHTVGQASALRMRQHAGV
jgi:hypothetical protein